MSSQEWFENLYRKHGKRILIIPILLFLIYAFLIFVQPGVKYGADFRGGILVSFTSPQPVDAEKIMQAIKAATGATDVTVTPTTTFEGGKTEYGAIVEIVYPEKKNVASDTNTAETVTLVAGSTDSENDFKNTVVNIIKKEVPGASSIVVREVTPTLGATFWHLAINMAFWAFILLLVTVFIFFRQGKPTLIMIGSAVFDLMGMVALMALFNIPLTMDTIVILLMMVGYSIDTDIVLFTHVLKRTKEEEGDPEQRAARAASTGIHMSGTTLVAMLFVYAVGYFTRNLTVLRIANVMIFGLLSDLVVTWFLNAPVMIELVRKNESSA
jgi:preprotein translocase subunit SecF